MKRALLFVLLFIATIGVQAQWVSLGSGLNGKVNTVVEFGGNLYAGGQFTASGSTSLSYIAKWNGSIWQPVGEGFNGEVKTLVVYQNALYAGGSFTASGTTTINNVAKLNGNSWTQVGNGLNQLVNCLYVFNNKLYAGGVFSQSGTMNVNRVAVFESGTWINPNNDVLTGQINTMVEHNGSLYIGGFWQPPHIKRLDATSWTQLPNGGPDGPVYKLASFQYQSSSTKYLWIGGDFSPSGWFGICTYNNLSNTFSSPFNNFNSPSKVYSFYTSYSNLYAGGLFSVSPSGFQTSVNLSKKGFTTPWDTVSAVFNTGGTVYSIGTYNSKLVVAGTFTTINGSSYTNIAMKTNTVGVEELSSYVSSKTFYPNPMLQEATLDIRTLEYIKDPVLKVMDNSGRLVYESSDNLSQDALRVEFRVNRSSFAAGLYYYTVSDNEGRGLTHDKFIVE